MRHGLDTWLSTPYIVVPYRLLDLYLKLSSLKLSNQFSDIWRAFGAFMFLLEPRDERGKLRGPLLLWKLSNGYVDLTVHHEKEKLLLIFVAGSAVQYSAGPTVHNGTGETVQQRYRISPIDHKDTV
jgi:hypothetical protein